MQFSSLRRTLRDIIYVFTKFKICDGYILLRIAILFYVTITCLEVDMGEIHFENREGDISEA